MVMAFAGPSPQPSHHGHQGYLGSEPRDGKPLGLSISITLSNKIHLAKKEKKSEISIQPSSPWLSWKTVPQE